MLEKFNKLKEKYPNLSDIMIFVKMVRNKRVTSFDLKKWFDRLVPKVDYVGTPKEQILSWIKSEIIKK